MSHSKRVSKGVYRDSWGYRVCWRDGGHQREKRFPLDTPLDVLKGFRRRQVGNADGSPREKTGLARDIVRFLRHRKAMPSFVTERAQLRAWLRLYPRLSRWALTAQHVRHAVAQWQATGYSAQEIRHRVRKLRQLYRTLDGPSSPTPCDGVRLPAIPKSRPVPVPDDLIRQVAIQLRIAETKGIGRLRSAKTRARYLVLATTGQRPAQLMRAQPTDVDLERRLWVVRPAKGDAGTILVLNDDMAAAWALFTQAKAWGTFDTRSFVRTLQRNGWPKAIRPYNLRHSVGFALSAAGVDLGDISALLGHKDLRTTRSFYVPALLARQARASATIDGRIGPTAMMAASTAPATNPDKAGISQTFQESTNEQKTGLGIPKHAKRA